MKIAFVLILIRLALGDNFVCPGGKRECPSGSTCCQLPSGSYGCCPLPHAVCCNDHIHCCPERTRCEAGGCYSNHYNESLNISNTSKHSTLCPGGKYTCPEDSTCCKNPQSLIYSCCLLPHAVCCDDGESCCPQFSTCDLASKKCIKKGFYLQMYSMLKTKSKLNKEHFAPLSKLYNKSSVALNSTSVICPGGQYQCPDGSTCCKLPDGRYGCCPFQNAVCCPDHQHCCPQGMKCDLSSEACTQGGMNVTWSQTVLAVQVSVTRN